MNTTAWGRGSNAIPLYSDWRVSFTTGSGCISIDKHEGDAGSVSTSSLSSDDSVGAKPQDDTVEGQPSDEQDQDEEIDVQHQDEVDGEVYFSVHRNMIGPKSVFFTQSFAGEIENSSCSKIALPSNLPPHAFASVVQAFELLLGYCYNIDSSSVVEQKMNTKNAVALFCLCNFFGMDADICKKVRDFIKSDLNHETVAEYYQIVKDMRQHETKDKIVLDVNPIMDMVVIMCHQCPGTLNSKTELFKIADLALWLPIGSLLARDDNNNVEGTRDDDEGTSGDASKVWSANLTSFFNTLEQDNDDCLQLKDSFRTLTSENIIPEVSSDVALQLLEHEHKLGLAFMTLEEKKDKLNWGDSLEASNATDDITISTKGSDEDVVVEDGLSGASNLTNLQQRCIKALCESNWSGEENNAEQKRGKLVKITTPSVLEALLVDSVTGERFLNAKMEEMQADLKSQKITLKQQIETYEFKKDETKVEIAKEKQKQLSLHHKLEETRSECEALKQKLAKFEAKAEKDKSELCKANAKLEADLDKEKKKSYSVNLRYRALEKAQDKIETDREMFEMSVKDTIKRLDSMTSYEEAYGACGLGPLVLLISAMSDRNECFQIKSMLEQVLKDPLTYERNFLMKKDSTDTDEENMERFLEDYS